MIHLREVRPEDLPTHFEQQRDPESNAMAVVAARDREAFDEHWRKLLANPEVVLRTIADSDEVVGSALSFVRNGRREVGYWIGREHWGQGIASAALGQLLEIVTERPVYATVAAHNGASLRVLYKHGFREIGRRDAICEFELA